MTNESNKRWVLPGDVPTAEAALFRKLSFDRFESQLLYARSLDSEEKITNFFSEDLDKIPDPAQMFDAVGAAEKIVSAAKEGKKIIIHGDFDADGICAVSILWDFLYRELAEVLGDKVDALPYIPDRSDEGYGLSEKSIDNIVEMGAQLVITVDCGIRDTELISATMAENPGIQFVVTDHHQLPADFDQKDLEYSIVHPNHPKGKSPDTDVCGTYVAYQLTRAMRDLLKISDKRAGLDLVALATVTDIMPLRGVNRLIVKKGLEQINSGERIGLKKLIELAKVELGSVDSYHLGYALGPRINAAGRIGSALDAVKLLVTRKKSTAQSLAKKLNNLNFERQKLTQDILDAARSDIETSINEGGAVPKGIFVYGEDWPEGIVGLVAGKLQEAYYRPTLVATVKDGEVRGSARSLRGFNITSAIEKFDKYLIKFGGHEQAAGFSVKSGKIEIFRRELLTYIETELDDSILQPQLYIDAVMDTEELSLTLARKIEKFAPFGYGNRKPMIMLPDVVVVGKEALGRKVDTKGNPLHMKLKFKSASLGISEAVMFNCADDFDKIEVDDIIDFAGYISVNEWNGYTNVQFQVREWRMGSG
ncbi:single-stranded-DNA-specific exonuclease RecJ [Candidatus Dojkabacteria bacterium]|nr:single-stranded-DNA-specific exonuclease RecJ [Candidatus Dojkabacteria bacterium]